MAHRRHVPRDAGHGVHPLHARGARGRWATPCGPACRTPTTAWRPASAPCATNSSPSTTTRGSPPTSTPAAATNGTAPGGRSWYPPCTRWCAPIPKPGATGCSSTASSPSRSFGLSKNESNAILEMLYRHCVNPNTPAASAGRPVGGVLGQPGHPALRAGRLRRRGPLRPPGDPAGGPALRSRHALPELIPSSWPRPGSRPTWASPYRVRRHQRRQLRRDLTMVAGAPLERARRIAAGRWRGSSSWSRWPPRGRPCCTSSPCGGRPPRTGAVGHRPPRHRAVRGHRGPATEDAGLARKGRRPATERAVGRSFTAGLLVTIAAGGDNLAVYIPLFHEGGTTNLLTLAVVFALGEVAVTMVILAAGRHPPARSVMAKLGALAVPLSGVRSASRTGLGGDALLALLTGRRSGAVARPSAPCLTAKRSVEGGPIEQLQGKVAVITGAASGIGKAVATPATAEGMKVVLADTEENALKEAADSSLPPVPTSSQP